MYNRLGRYLTKPAIVVATGASLAISVAAVTEGYARSEIEVETDVEVANWSNTHRACVNRVFFPSNTVELERIVRWAHLKKEKIRPIGTGLSPNGCAFQEEGMISLAQCDRILEVDTDKMQITVEAGAKVSAVLQELKKYNLTLENFSSIQEQQVGGWTQMAAHGTGAGLSTVEEQIVRMTLVTPALGKIELSRSEYPNIFRFAKAGLGALGIVSELTLQCVPRYRLKEKQYVVPISDIREKHADLLRTYRHVRYMWIPHTDSVVVVVSNPTDDAEATNATDRQEAALEPFRKLLLEDGSDAAPAGTSFSGYRELLLAKDPLSLDRVRKVNAAEAEYYKLASGERTADSVDVLGFDCGGEQFVIEVAFPCGTRDEPNLCDIDFVEGLMRRIEASGVPAHAPIEQRWTARSESAMSPSYSESPEDIFSWVGIILYVPSALSDAQREAVTASFRTYAYDTLRPECERHGAYVHWAKIETCDDKPLQTRARTAKRYPVEAFNKARKTLDPNGVLANEWLERAL
eukprot:g2554.t1